MANSPNEREMKLAQQLKLDAKSNWTLTIAQLLANYRKELEEKQ